MLIRSRRDFLKGSVQSVTALGAMSALAKFGQMNAFASPLPSSGYQALVCIFLAGGNDGHNTVIPISTYDHIKQDYNVYRQNRGGLALSQGSLLPIHDGNDVYGLHPSMPELQALYNQGSAAVLANVGMLVQPTDRAAYTTPNNNAVIPVSLFSHSDQSSQWQSAIPNGIAGNGWGGGLADAMVGQNQGALFPPITAISSCGLFCTGKDTFPASVPPPAPGSTAATGIATLNAVHNAPAAAPGMQQLLTFDNGLQLVQAGNGIVNRGLNYANTINSMLNNISITTPFPANGLASQLKTVAKMMAVRNQLGLTRQIFFCQLGGFDTHTAQLATQQALLAQLSSAVAAFYNATKELHIEQSVTTFTASEFGRTLSPSGTDGSDHAWGSHHFVIGGSVQGGKLYGAFPSLSFGSDHDANNRGTLIPTTSVSQYGATMAQWFGVDPANLAKVFPNIVHFASEPTLGFLG